MSAFYPKMKSLYDCWRIDLFSGWNWGWGSLGIQILRSKIRVIQILINEKVLEVCLGRVV
jgi:hypothetical protein